MSVQIRCPTGCGHSANVVGDVTTPSNVPLVGPGPIAIRPPPNDQMPSMLAAPRADDAPAASTAMVARTSTIDLERRRVRRGREVWRLFIAANCTCCESVSKACNRHVSRRRLGRHYAAAVSDAIRLRQDIAWREIDGEIVLLDLTGAAYYSVSRSGVVLWQA